MTKKRANKRDSLSRIYGPRTYNKTAQKSLGKYRLETKMLYYTREKPNEDQVYGLYVIVSVLCASNLLDAKFLMINPFVYDL